MPALEQQEEEKSARTNIPIAHLLYVRLSTFLAALILGTKALTSLQSSRNGCLNNSSAVARLSTSTCKQQSRKSCKLRLNMAVRSVTPFDNFCVIPRGLGFVWGFGGKDGVFLAGNGGGNSPVISI
uniref:Uncharacterized protein n=1 Tax=Glossina pallidipes TaxID=7398 RepID=A0A1A9Z6H8_GLOPL